jgi:hypothetical protein
LQRKPCSAWPSFTQSRPPSEVKSLPHGKARGNPSPASDHNIQSWLEKQFAQIPPRVPRYRCATVCPLITTTAKLNDFQPFSYLKDILERMPAGYPISRLDELLPWNWRPETPLH